MKKILALSFLAILAACSSVDDMEYENAAREVCLKKGLSENSQEFEDCRKEEYYHQFNKDSAEMKKAEKEIEREMKEQNRSRDIHRGIY